MHKEKRSSEVFLFLFISGSTKEQLTLFLKKIMEVIKLKKKVVTPKK